MMKMMTMIIIIISMIMWKTKSMKKMVILFSIYTLTTSMLMASMIQLTLIPFILILTILGGLSILFMYMTATMEKTHNSKSSGPVLIYLMMMLPNIMQTKDKMMIKNKMENLTYKEPTMNMFNPDNSWIIMILMMMIIMTMIYIINSCSKIKTPVRQKVNPWN